jgi:formylglycine-generating enzyme required for sulfatase activity
MDCWHPSYVGAPTDGRAWMTGDCRKHVLRGGSWNNTPIFIRSAARSGSAADGVEFDYSSIAGFRLARDLP